MTSKELMAVNQLSSPADFASVETIVNQWIVENDIAPLTQKSYRTAAKVFVNWLSDNGVELNENALIDYREWLKLNRSTSSAKLYFTICRKLTAWLAKRGYIARNFADGLKGIKLDTSVHARDALTLDESVDVLNSMTGKTEKALRDKCIMLLAFSCGLRAVEIVRLDVGDIEKRRGIWTARIWGKARAGKVDTIVIPDEVKAVIDRYLKVRGKVSPNAPLFSSTSRRNFGKRIQTQNISRLAKRAFLNVGIDSRRVVFHSCRHSQATLALEFGATLDEVSKNLRHKSLAVTEIYRHDVQIFTNTATRLVAAAIFQRLKGVNIYG